MNLGTFTKHENGNLTGTVTTLLNSFDIEYRPVANKTGNGPDYRIYRPGTDVEVGLAWAATGEFSRKEYLNSVIDSPELPAGIWAALVTEADGSHVLKWSRPNPNRKTAAQNGGADSQSAEAA